MTIQTEQPQTTPSNQPQSAGNGVGGQAGLSLIPAGLGSGATALHRSSFALLGANTRDNAQRIVELAEEKALQLDDMACQKARSDLTSPRARLGAEMGWLPGVSPQRANQYLDAIVQNPQSIREDHGLPTLAQLNLMAAAFELIDPSKEPDGLADFIQEMADLAGELSFDDVLRDINEDRTISGFPQIASVDQIEAEVGIRNRYYRDVIKRALAKLPTTKLVEVMTKLADDSTLEGELPAPALVDELVDSYALEAQDFLVREAENVQRLVELIRSVAEQGGSVVDPYIVELVAVLRNWDRVAQPIQLSAKARGIDHEPSQHLAKSVRSLAADLLTDHDMLSQTQRLIDVLQELFVEIPDVSDQLDADVEALADITDKRQKSEAEQREWERQITYSADVGVIFKDTLSICPAGVSWKGKRYPLESVSRVRWGGVRHSTNGIPTGTTYTLGFGDNQSSTTVELKKEAIYSAFTEKLWAGICTRLIWELFAAVKAGKQVRFGGALIRDDGVTLVKHKLFVANEPVRCGWGDVQVWNRDGSFYVGHKADKKTYVELSYISDWNTHVLEAAIRTAFKKGVDKLSDVLS